MICAQMATVPVVPALALAGVCLRSIVAARCDDTALHREANRSPPAPTRVTAPAAPPGADPLATHTRWPSVVPRSGTRITAAVATAMVLALSRHHHHHGCYSYDSHHYRDAMTVAAMTLP